MSAYRKMVPTAILLTIGAFAATPSIGATTVGSGAYGISVRLNVANALGATVGPLASVSDLTGSPVYSDNTHLLNAGSNTAVLATTGSGLNVNSLRFALTTGVMNTSATGGPLPSAQSADASALVDGLNFSLINYLLNTPILSVFSLTAATLNSTANANGTPAANVGGTAGITNLNLTVAGLSLIADSNVFANAPANTDLLGFLNLAPITGLSIIVNEQIRPVTNNAAGARITTNALHVIFNGFPIIGGQALRGDVIVSQSRAFIESANSPTPEPAVWAQMIAGFGLIGMVTRRRGVAA